VARSFQGRPSDVFVGDSMIQYISLTVTILISVNPMECSSHTVLNAVAASLHWGLE